MHRVRVGLIGLAWVFLLVMLATTFLHVAGADRSANKSAATTNDTTPSEPLAELGVAPGNTPPDTSAAPPQPPSIRLGRVGRGFCHRLIPAVRRHRLIAPSPRPSAHLASS